MPSRSALVLRVADRNAYAHAVGRDPNDRRRGGSKRVATGDCVRKLQRTGEDRTGDERLDCGEDEDDEAAQGQASDELDN